MDTRKPTELTDFSQALPTEASGKSTSWVQVSGPSSKPLFYIHAGLFEMGLLAVSSEQPTSKEATSTANSSAVHVRDRALHIVSEKKPVDRSPNHSPSKQLKKRRMSSSPPERSDRLERMLSTDTASTRAAERVKPATLSKALRTHQRLLERSTVSLDDDSAHALFNPKRKDEVYLPFLLDNKDAAPTAMFAHTWHGEDTAAIDHLKHEQAEESAKLLKQHRSAREQAKLHLDSPKKTRALEKKLNEELAQTKRDHEAALTKLGGATKFVGFKKFATEACFLGASFTGINPMGAKRAILKHDLPFYPGEKIASVRLSEEIHAHEVMFDHVLGNIARFVNQYAADDAPKELDFHMPYYDYALFVVELFLNGKITLKATERALNIIFEKKLAFEERVQTVCDTHNIRVNIISPFDNLFGHLEQKTVERSYRVDDLPPSARPASPAQGATIKETIRYFLPSFANDTAHSETPTASALFGLLGINPELPQTETALAPTWASRLTNSDHVINLNLHEVWKDFMAVHDANGEAITTIDDLFHIGNAVMQGITAKGTNPLETCSMVAFTGKQIQLGYEHFTQIRKLLKAHEDLIREAVITERSYDSVNGSKDETLRFEIEMPLKEKMRTELDKIAAKVPPEKLETIRSRKESDIADKVEKELAKRKQVSLESEVTRRTEINPAWQALKALEVKISLKYPPIFNMSLLDPLMTYDPRLDEIYAATQSAHTSSTSQPRQESYKHDEECGKTYNGLTFYSEMLLLAPFLRESGIIEQVGINAAAYSMRSESGMPLEAFLDTWYQQQRERTLRSLTSHEAPAMSPSLQSTPRTEAPHSSGPPSQSSSSHSSPEKKSSTTGRRSLTHSSEDPSPPGTPSPQITPSSSPPSEGFTLVVRSRRKRQTQQATTTANEKEAARRMEEKLDSLILKINALSMTAPAPAPPASYHGAIHAVLFPQAQQGHHPEPSPHRSTATRGGRHRRLSTTASSKQPTGLTPR